MKKTFLVLVFLGIGYWLPVSPAYAEAPNLITYQGRLKENNQPVTGNRNVEIFLCDAVNGGSCQTSGVQDVYVSTGLFKSTFTVPGTVDLSAGGWWLELKVGSDVLSPRERLSSVPYALNSATASYANNLAASAGAAAVISSTHVYIVSGGSLTVAGAVSASIFFGDGSGLTNVAAASGTDSTKVLKAGDTMTGPLTAPDYVATYGITASSAVFSSGVEVSSLTVLGNAFSVGGSTFVVANGNVGIGTANPGAQLSVVGGMSLTGTLTGDQADFQGGSMLVRNGSGKQLTIGQSGSSNYVQIEGGGTLEFNHLGTSPANWYFNDGNVGVGTVSPLSKFDVADGSITVRGANAGLVLENASRVISPETSAGLGAGIRVSTNVYIVGFSSAARYYGDGSGLTGVAASLVSAAGVQAGSLGAGVIASSVAVNGVYPAAVQAGTYGISITGTSAGAAPTGAAGGDLSGAYPNPSIASLPVISGVNLTNLTAANIAAGSLGAGVIASSIAVDAVYTGAIADLAVTDAKLATGINGSKIGSGVPAANIAAGSLGAGVIASSAAVGSVYDGAITAVSGAKVSGDIAGNAANITGNLAAAQIAAGSLGAGVIASSIAVGAVYTGAIADLAVTDAKLATGINGSKIGSGVPAANIAAGNLGSGVIASSAAVGSVYDGAITAVSALKLSGNVPAGSLGNAVLKTGDTMTGQLTVGNNSTMTVTGGAFSVGGSTLVVAGGNVGVGVASPGARLAIAVDTGNEIEFISAGANVQILATGSPGQFQIGGGTDFEINVGGSNRLQIDGAGTVAVGTLAASGDITAARYQIAGSTVLAVLPGAGSLGVGVDAGRVNTGNYNLFVGSAAGHSNTTGDRNSFVGHSAGYGNITASQNSFFGYYAGANNLTGSNNSIAGYNAGFYTRTGSANAMFGNEAGFGVYSQSFSSSTLIGYRAGYGLTTGNGNIFIGFQAGYNVAGGMGNIVIGYNKNTSAPAANNELNIGGVLYGDLSAGTIGIGKPLPQAALDIVSTGTSANQYAQIWRDSTGLVVASMTANGRLSTLQIMPGDNLGTHTAAADLSMAGFDIINASSITVAASKPGLTVSTHLYVMNGGVGIGNSFPGATRLWVQGSAAEDFHLRISSQNNTGGLLVVNKNGWVGIGTTSPANLFHVAGNSQFGGSMAVGSSYIETGGVFRLSAAPADMRMVKNGNNMTFDSADGKQYMTIVNQTGDVGIGTVTPAAKFEVSGGSVVLHGLDSQASVFQAGDNGIVISTGGAIQTTGRGYGSMPGALRGLGAVELQTVRSIAGQVASGQHSVIGGGGYNTASGFYSGVAAGNNNIASNGSAFVGGGSNNKADGYMSAISGGDSNSTGFFAYSAAVAGGQSNSASAPQSFIGGGAYNVVNGSISVISGGVYNTVSGTSAVISGGMNNTAAGEYSSVSGGYQNKAAEVHSAVAGGWRNNALGMDSFIGGGYSNQAVGPYSSIPGGSQNSAAGMYSFAAGFRSTAAANGTFTWKDSQPDSVINDISDQVRFKVRGGFWVSTSTVYDSAGLFVDANNNVGIGTIIPAFKLHVAGAGGTIAGLSTSANSTDAAVYGWANSGATAVKGVALGGYAGRFEGDVYVGDAAAIAGARLVVKGETSDSGKSSLNVINSGGTSLLYARNDGGVGIGTPNPAARLDVLETNTPAVAYTLKVGTDSVSPSLSVSTTGVVGMPSQSMVMAANPSFGLLNGGWNKIQFPAASVDTQKEYDNALFRFTARNRGMYLVSAHAVFAAGANNMGLAVVSNGGLPPTYSVTKKSAAAPSGDSMVISYPIPLNAGDFVEIFGYQDFTGALAINTQLTIVKLN